MSGRHRRTLAWLVLIGLTALATSCSGSIDPDEALAEGLVLQQAGNTEGAAELYLSVLDVRPDDKYANYNLGVIEQGEGRTELAESYYRASLDADPRFVPALFNLAIVRTSVGATQEAIDLYQRVLEADPGDAAAHFNLGISLQAAGRTRPGQVEINEALALDPTLVGRLETQPVAAPGQGDPAEEG
jgi:tetratricopeptide (TPR) repeat protein